MLVISKNAAFEQNTLWWFKQSKKNLHLESGRSWVSWLPIETGVYCLQYNTRRTVLKVRLKHSIVTPSWNTRGRSHQIDLLFLFMPNKCFPLLGNCLRQASSLSSEGTLSGIPQTLWSRSRVPIEEVTMTSLFIWRCIPQRNASCTCNFTASHPTPTTRQPLHGVRGAFPYFQFAH